MVRRGMTASRTEAAAAIRAGKVTVGGRPALKANTLVRADEPVLMGGPARRYVSRGGEKLEAALSSFGVDPRGRVAMDAGASTGGFTDALLSLGAARVISVDVGYGQFDWSLREDPRVTLLERTNVRELQPDALPELPDLVVADLSFISLRLALPALARCAAPIAELVLLVKPQFEAGRGEVGEGGVVTDPEVWGRAVQDVAGACLECGLGPAAVMASPLRGAAGNAEFLLLARRPPVPPGLRRQGIEEAVSSALESGRHD